MKKLLLLTLFLRVWFLSANDENKTGLVLAWDATGNKAVVRVDGDAKGDGPIETIAKFRIVKSKFENQ